MLRCQIEFTGRNAGNGSEWQEVLLPFTIKAALFTILTCFFSCSRIQVEVWGFVFGYVLPKSGVGGGPALQ